MLKRKVFQRRWNQKRFTIGLKDSMLTIDLKQGAIVDCKIDMSAPLTHFDVKYKGKWHRHWAIKFLDPVQPCGD